MVATREDWMTTRVIAASPSEDQALEFFGIPPSTADALNDNIRKKRTLWNLRVNRGDTSSQKKAQQVLTLIDSVTDFLKRGMASEMGGDAETGIPDSIFETLDELRRILDEHLFAGDYDEAIRIAREAINRWRNADAAAEFARVIVDLVASAGIVHPNLLAEGVQAAQLATREQPSEVRNWESLARLLLSSSKVQDAVAAIDRAESGPGGRTSAMLLILRTNAMADLKKPDEAMTAAVRAVSRAEPARASAFRSEAADILITWAASMLPIRSAADLTRYTELVGVAAWCSYGVPEAEDKVRAYRMWATNAGKRVFTGSDRMRSFLAVITGFISLPIHNRVRSRPAWQVFLEGQNQEKITDAFAIVAAPAYVQQIHHIKLDLSFRTG
jgi:tetratricopeptide (TPR) repeat protein